MQGLKCRSCKLWRKEEETKDRERNSNTLIRISRLYRLRRIFIVRNYVQLNSFSKLKSRWRGSPAYQITEPIMDGLFFWDHMKSLMNEMPFPSVEDRIARISIAAG
ncbi:hypothetical protein TNCV_494631 [Trichonephila clavipes]|nr:hypothetical protein TNCV_494631 [Trichonephila clavipes]